MEKDLSQRVKKHWDRFFSIRKLRDLSQRFQKRWDRPLSIREWKDLSQHFWKRWNRIHLFQHFLKPWDGHLHSLMGKDLSKCFLKCWNSVTLSQRFWASYTSIFEKRRYRPPIAALCKAPAKSASIGLSITAVCKNAGTRQFFCSVFRKI